MISDQDRADLGDLAMRAIDAIIEGYVVHDLYSRRPFPVMRRCKSCRARRDWGIRR